MGFFFKLGVKEPSITKSKREKWNLLRPFATRTPTNNGWERKKGRLGGPVLQYHEHGGGGGMKRYDAHVKKPCGKDLSN